MKKFKNILFPTTNKPFCDSDGRIYRSMSINSEILGRYKCITEKITVVCSAQIIENKSGQEIYFDDSFVDVVNVPTIKPTNFIQRSFIIKKAIKDNINQSDAVITKVPGNIELFLIKLCKKYKKFLLFEVVGCPWDSLRNYGTLQGKVIAPFIRYRTKRAIKKAQYVLYVSRFYLQNRYPNNHRSFSCPDVDIIIPPVDILDKRYNRISSNSSNRVFVVGTFGYLNCNYRRFDTSIRCVKELIDRGYNVELRILGAGNQSKWQEYANSLHINNNVKFSGFFKSKNEVNNWIDDIDTLILPTEAETLGRFCIEAMSRGCPVAGTVETALNEQLGSDCLFHIGDYLEASNIIEKLIVDNDYYFACSKENYYRSFKYSRNKVMKDREKFYVEFCQKAHVD